MVLLMRVDVWEDGGERILFLMRGDVWEDGGREMFWLKIHPNFFPVSLLFSHCSGGYIVGPIVPSRIMVVFSIWFSIFDILIPSKITHSNQVKRMDFINHSTNQHSTVQPLTKKDTLN